MNGLWLVPPARLVLVVCSAAGLLAGVATVATAGALVAAARQDDSARALLEATHLPPLLTIPGENVNLEYEAFCVGTNSEAEVPCEVSGTVFARPNAGGEFDRIALRPEISTEGRRLVARVPEQLAASPSGFQYYAVLEEPTGRASVTLPPAGADAPHESVPLDEPVDVDLGRHVFGSTRAADERVAAASWGGGPTEVGLESGRNLGPIGASAFAVDPGGAVYVLDQAKRRVLRWDRHATSPVRIPVSISGTLADMTVSPDGSIYVLETVGEPGHSALVRRFDFAGRELERVEVAERTASQIGMSAQGPVILQQPSHHWTLMSQDGSMASPHAQRRSGRVGRPLPSGEDVVVLRVGGEVRVGLTGRNGIRRSWRVRSATPLGEVQLAQPLGDRLAVVVRTYTDRDAEFLVVVLGRRGLVSRASLSTADWSETAPLGRFELMGSSLYRLGSNPRGAFVDRYDLEVH